MSMRNVSLLMIAAGLIGSAVAETHDLNWHTVDGGGYMTSAGGKYTLDGTIGQPDAGPLMSGGPFQLIGGFWVVAADVPPAPGDCDEDGSVNLLDYATMPECLTGPGVFTSDVGCHCLDFDGNGTIDLLDFAAFQVAANYP